MRERVTADAARGVQWAPLLLPEIDRKLVKQTVMTSVYGVTFVGARGQITNRLKERGFKEPSPDMAYHIAFYAAQVCPASPESHQSCSASPMHLPPTFSCPGPTEGFGLCVPLDAVSFGRWM